MFSQRPRCTAVSSVDVGNFLDSLCVDSKKHNKKKRDGVRGKELAAPARAKITKTQDAGMKTRRWMS